MENTNPEPLNPQGTYHNLGVGRQESLHEAPAPEAPLPQTAPAPQKKSPWPKRILAAAIALAVVAGSCCVTAWTVNRRWEEETAKLETEFENRLAQLQTQLQSQIDAQTDANAGYTGTSSQPTAGGMTPTQVYAQNVDSVVAVSNYASSEDRWGGDSGTYLQGTGSGFIISENGYIITNYHVIENAAQLTITTHTGEEYSAQLVGSDQVNDVALLKIEAENLNAAQIGSSDELLVGDMVIAIGNPLGELTATATVGYVSGKDRAITTDGTIINMLQTDAAINSGNSGGPLFNMKGQVIGITTAKYSGASASGASIEGIGFAIPINDVVHMIEDFKNYGYLRNQAYLGVTVMNLDSGTAGLYSVPPGSFVQGVVSGGCAELAGIRPGDIITGIGSYAVDSNATLTNTLRRFSAGDTTTVTVYRDGEELTLEITFDERPQNAGLEDTRPLEEGEMPSTGSYDDWRDYFDRYFGTP